MYSPYAASCYVAQPYGLTSAYVGTPAYGTAVVGTPVVGTTVVSTPVDKRIDEVDDSLRDINLLLHSYNSIYDKKQNSQRYINNQQKISNFPSHQYSNTPISPTSENPLNTSIYETSNHISYSNNPYYNQHSTSYNQSYNNLENYQYPHSQQLFNKEHYQSPSNNNYFYLHQTAAPPVSTLNEPLISTSVDTSCLDDILIDSGMSKSSSHWKTSFNGIREKYNNGYFNDTDNTNSYNSSSNSLPRRKNDYPSFLSKSTSYHTYSTSKNLDTNKGLLQAAVERKAHEAPEMLSSSQGFNHTRRSGTDMGAFWLNTIRKTPINKQIMTAAERLEKLQEPAYVNSYHGGSDNKISTTRTFLSNTLPIKRSGTHSVAAKKSLFSSSPTDYGNNNSTRNRISSKSLNRNIIISTPHIDLSDLEDAVAQLTTKNDNINNYSNNNNNNLSKTFTTSSLTAGLHRFPTGDYNNINNNILNNIEKSNNLSPSKYLSSIHSPSPESGGTETSQLSTPIDLPHPKPKHNLREQIINASIQATPFINERQVSPSRMIFPITNTGQVANKISSYEKKASSPTPPNLTQLASQLNGNGMFPSNVDETSRSTSSSPCRSPVALSPKSTVFRTKPIIHIDNNYYNNTNQNGYQNKNFPQQPFNSNKQYDQTATFNIYQVCFSFYC
uniref:ZM domain-containing protein n=1 Tax=Parastrongyloides trichosuri TaxID=131310 RepID=A0A0N4ZPZ8_PARTI